MTSTDNIVTLAAHASFRAIGEEGIILMTDSGQLYSTNASGTAFMKRVGDGATVGAILAELEGEFDVEADVLKADICELIDYLSEEGVVQIDDGA